MFFHWSFFGGSLQLEASWNRGTRRTNKYIFAHHAMQYTRYFYIWIYLLVYIRMYGMLYTLWGIYMHGINMSNSQLHTNTALQKVHQVQPISVQRRLPGHPTPFHREKKNTSNRDSSKVTVSPLTWMSSLPCWLKWASRSWQVVFLCFVVFICHFTTSWFKRLCQVRNVLEDSSMCMYNGSIYTYFCSLQYMLCVVRKIDSYYVREYVLKRSSRLKQEGYGWINVSWNVVATHIFPSRSPFSS